MRIVVVLPRTNTYCEHRPNSIETVVRTLLAESRYRRDVTVICDEGAILPSRGNVIAVPAGLSRRERTLAVAHVLRWLKPDLIEHHQQLGRAADLARMFPRAINVFYRHTSMPTPKGPLDAARYAARLRPFDRLVMVAQATADAFLADFPAFARRTSTISNPIDVEGWRASVEDKQPLILFAGRAMPDKGLDLVCAAIAQALDAAPAWRASLMLSDWHMHGDWAEPHIRTLARFGERVRVRTNAPLTAVRAETRRAAIALTPSRVREGLSLSALEAHAAGAALVSSGRGGLREASGPHAVYIEPDRPAVLAEAILGLIENPQRREALALAGQDRVASEYSPAGRAAQLDALRSQLLTAHERKRTRLEPASLFGARFGVPPAAAGVVFRGAV